MRLGKKYTDSSNPNVRRVTLIRQLGGLGDVLCVGPVALGIKEKYGFDCNVTMITSPLYMAGVCPMIFKRNPYIDRVVRADPYQFAPHSLKYAKPEYRGVPNDGWIEALQETDLIVDLNCICSIVETRTQPNVTQHRTDIWCEAAGVNPSCKRPVLTLTKEEKDFGFAWCNDRLGEGTRVGVVLQTQAEPRNWPYAAEFAEILLQRGYKVCTIDCVRRINDKIPAVIGMDVLRVAAILENVDAVVSPDTGILHLAGTVGTPVLGLFGSTDGALRMREYAGHWSDTRKVVDCGPCCYCYPCKKSEDKRDYYQCMKRLTTSFVLYELEQMLDRFGCPVP
jgi:ADP-heptose:LPS heptosyltransferase